MGKKRNRDSQQSASQLAKPELRQIIRREVLAVASFSGPLPPPEILARYNEAIPDGAERIMVMAELQNKHRMSLETRVVEADIRRANWGLAAGFIVAMVGLIVAYLMVDGGHTTAGITIGSLDLVSLVGAFIYGTVSRRGERQQRTKSLMPAES